MYRKLRLSILLALMALLVAAIPFAQAQETFGLSADDFALFSSQDFEADSYSFDYALNLNVTGAPDGDVTASFTGSAVLGSDDAGNPVGSFSIAGSADAAGESNSMNMEFRLVDGLLYMNMGDGSGWIGQDAADMLEGFSSMIPVPMGELASGDMSSDPQAMQAMGEVMSALSDPSTLEYISISRMDDMNGAAHFQVNLDLAGFLSSDAFTQMMDAAGTMSGDDSLSGMGAMMAMLFQDMSLTFDEYINLADSRVGQAVLDFAMSVNPAMAASMTGSSDSSAASATPIDVHFSLDVNNMQYNQPVSVTAPEDAMVMPSKSTSGG